MGAAENARRALRRQQRTESAHSVDVGSRGSGKSWKALSPGHLGASINAAGILMLRHWRGVLCLALLAAISYSPALDAESVWDA